MTESEKIAKLCEKANVTESEAREILEQVNWDLLDAILLLERQGRLKDASAHYSTQRDESAESGEQASDFKQRASSVGAMLQRAIQVGNANSFVVSRKGKRLFSLSVTAMAILLVYANVWLLIALVAGLFFGLRYSIEGEQLGKPSVNDVMDKAATAAENVRVTVVDSFRDKK